MIERLFKNNVAIAIYSCIPFSTAHLFGLSNQE